MSLVINGTIPGPTASNIHIFPGYNHSYSRVENIFNQTGKPDWQEFGYPSICTKKNTTHLSSDGLKEPTCEELMIQGDTYFLWKNISVENAKIHLISHSASNGRFAISRFKEVHSRFMDVFGKTKENIRFNILYLSPEKASSVLQTMTDQGTFFEDDKNIIIHPDSNMRDKYGSFLLDLHMNITDAMHDFDEASYLNIFDNTLLHLINPEERTEEFFPDIKDIIEGKEHPIYYYKLIEYLFEKKRAVFDKMVTYRQNQQNDLLKKELDKLVSLNASFKRFLKNSPLNLRRFAATETTPLERSITNNFQKTIKALEECSRSNPLLQRIIDCIR